MRSVADATRRSMASRGFPGRPAAMADIAEKVLYHRHVGPFHGASQKSLDAICLGSRVLEMRRGQVLFYEGEPVQEWPVFVLLRGEFGVLHEIMESIITVSTDAPGAVIGEVEYLTRGVSAQITGRGETDCAKATLVCASGTATLLAVPAPLLLDTTAAEPCVTANMLRLLCIKILQRNFYSDCRVVSSKPKQLVYKELSKRFAHDADLEPGSGDLFYLKEGISKKGVASLLKIPASDVSTTYARRLSKQGLTWYRAEIGATGGLIGKLRAGWWVPCNESIETE